MISDPQSPLRLLLRNQKPPLAVERMYTLKQTAEALGLGTLAVRRAIKSGRLAAHRLHPRGPFKIKQSEIERVLSSEK